MRPFCENRNEKLSEKFQADLSDIFYHFLHTIFPNFFNQLLDKYNRNFWINLLVMQSWLKISEENFFLATLSFVLVCFFWVPDFVTPISHCAWLIRLLTIFICILKFIDCNSVFNNIYSFQISNKNEQPSNFAFVCSVLSRWHPIKSITSTLSLFIKLFFAYVVYSTTAVSSKLSSSDHKGINLAMITES